MDFTNLRYYFQHCWNCGSLSWSLTTLCHTCFLKLEDEVKSSQCGKNIESFPLYCLLELNSKNGIGFQWIYSLKRSQCHRKNFSMAAELLIRQAVINYQNLQGYVFITPPSSHSVDLTLRIAEQLNSSFYNNLHDPVPTTTGLFSKLKKTKKSQKNLNIIQRRMKEYLWDGPSLTNEKVIFVDDVVTTGSTALAAWEAIGKPKDFKIWCLGYRPKLKNN